MSDIFDLLKGLITYINHIYKSEGLEALILSSNPSIDDLVIILDEIQAKLNPNQLNAVQAVILTKLLLSSIKADETYDLDDQFKQLIASLSTIDKREFLI